MKIRLIIVIILLIILSTITYAGDPAVRIGDQFVTQCGPGYIIIGSPTVLINGVPAVRLNDPAGGGLVIGGFVSTASTSILIDNMPAARMVDIVTGMCLLTGIPVPFSGPFIQGSPNVFIG